MSSNSNLLWLGAFLILTASLQASNAHSEELSAEEDVLDDGALENLEMELHVSCESQRGGESRLYLSSQILDRTERLGLVLKRKFMSIHNYFRNPYEFTVPAQAPVMQTREHLQFEVENLERLERQGQSYEEI